MKEQNSPLLLPLDDAGDRDPVLVWPGVFGNANPVELEIGIGKGRFLLDAAQRQPEVNYVGIEWASKYLRLALGRAERRGLANVRLVHVDAREFVEFFVGSGSLQALHLYFPDPWPKKRHHKRRLFDASFLDHVERVLRPGGLFWLATDHAEYYAVMTDLLAQRTNLVQVDEVWAGTATNYEAKYVVEGRAIHRQVLRRVALGGAPGAAAAD
jgi:tRNA (guanine-N7-)-methyltransferase